jgi:hypothetical protein
MSKWSNLSFWEKCKTIGKYFLYTLGIILGVTLIVVLAEKNLLMPTIYFIGGVWLVGLFLLFIYMPILMITQGLLHWELANLKWKIIIVLISIVVTIIFSAFVVFVLCPMFGMK